MVDIGQLRHPTSMAAIWKWALVIGLGATCAAGAIIVDASLAVPPPLVTAPAAAETAVPLEATSTTSAAGTAPTTATVEMPPPVTSLPPETPKVAIAKPREAAPAKAAHFQSCLPACETRDPQIAGLAPPPVAQAPVAPTVLEPPTPVPPPLIPYGAPPPPPRDVVDLAFDGGRNLLHRAEGASDAVVTGARRALGVAIDLVW